MRELLIIVTAALLLAASSSCNDSAPPAPKSLLLGPSGPVPLGVTSCVTLAPANDGLDDRLIIQSKLDGPDPTGDKASCLGPGRYEVSVNEGSGQAFIGSLNLSGGMTLVGAGPGSTILHFTGTRNGAWDAVRMYGGHNYLGNLTIDTSDMVLGDEQSHAIEIVGNAIYNPDGTTPTDGNTVQNVNFIHPHVPGQERGDCVRILGEQAFPVTNTIITDNHMTKCKRSGVAIQRGVYDWTITDNTINDVTDNQIDGEQSGSAKNGRGIISGNTFFAQTGKFAIQMSGMETADLVVSNNTIVGAGGIQCIQCRRTTVTGNVVVHTVVGAADATVVFFRASGPVTFSSNVVVRSAGTAGPVVSVTNDGVTNVPSNVVIANNYLRQDTASVGINVLSTTGLVATGNIVELGADVVGPHAIKVARNAAADPLNDDVAIIGNQLRGPWQIGLTLQATARATVGHNSMPATPGAKGLSCNASTTGPVVSSGNNWVASSCPIATGGNL
jgi:hypothetical protein